MTDIRQTIPIDGVTRFTLEARGAHVQVRWVDGADSVRVLDGELDVHRTGDEMFARGARSNARSEDVSEDPEIRITGFESPAQAVEEILLRTGIFGGRPRGKKGPPILLEIPTAIEHTTLEVEHGDLGLQSPKGIVVCKLKRGDFISSGGNAELDVSAGSGSVTIAGLSGSLRVAGGSGDISVSDSDAAINVKAGSGRISLLRVTGEAIKLAAGSGDVSVLESSAAAYSSDCGSGDVTIDGGALERISVRTGSGDVDCSAAFGPYQQSFTTGSGSISLGVPRNLSARIEAFTSSGDIDTELPLVSVGQRGPKSRRSRRQVGSVGTGDPRAEVSLRTSSGDIRISWLAQPGMSEVMPMPAPAERVDPTPDPQSAQAEEEDATDLPRSDQTQDERAILESLANGDITVEEADALLNALEGRQVNARR